ncbi:hypothetical protein ACFV2N_19105 [Streptomyces sp. NPDC059680]|uniref:hypothetical protein n=1 Tax=Streptomyces sp. NPDC059680 TaxID=3346904 RepID=UPI00369BA0B7
MVRLSKFQRLTLLAASTTVITAGVLSAGSAFAAPAAPHTAAVTTAGHPDAAPRWKQITDSPSGITVRLPGKPVVQKYSAHGVNSRSYLVPTGYGAMGFSVFDGPGKAPDKPWDLKTGLKGAVDGYNSGDVGARLRSTDVHDGTKDGDHYLEARLVGADGRTGHIRMVDHGEQAMMVMIVGTDDQRHAVDQDYRQVLDSIKAPEHGPRAEGSAVSI